METLLLLFGIFVAALIAFALLNRWHERRAMEDAIRQVLSRPRRPPPARPVMKKALRRLRKHSWQPPGQRNDD